ncbi:MAG: hypothetical protein UY76_C0021G0022 [Candidatus Uhrbacteria bacterium GW2011_GWA2_52_8d]|uniref:Uncharacterized protein n=1 Tax=Candidatus Uhrbacteria bacterium GW2011_GWA2_52_8d TaxID=1618979 RepID=A0A0G1XP12_9BACT|nr:MAG: hypothetical protein UY76_C0021G0022 [Candidatus Uhrbacteria bacterium GW2011_GWA2_52_8d]
MPGEKREQPKVKDNKDKAEPQAVTDLAEKLEQRGSILTEKQRKDLLRLFLWEETRNQVENGGFPTKELGRIVGKEAAAFIALSDILAFQEAVHNATKTGEKKEFNPTSLSNLLVVFFEDVQAFKTFFHEGYFKFIPLMPESNASRREIADAFALWWLDQSRGDFESAIDKLETQLTAQRPRRNVEIQTFCDNLHRQLVS